MRTRTGPTSVGAEADVEDEDEFDMAPLPSKPISYRAVFETDGRPVSKMHYVAAFGVFVLFAFVLMSSYSLHGATENQHVKAATATAVLPSREGFQAVKHCPDQLKTCRDKLSNCGEDAAGCQLLLTQCRRIALACKKALTHTKTTDLPRDWFKPDPGKKQEEWNVRPDPGWGLNKLPEKPHLKCGKHGRHDVNHEICKCSILYGGPDCSLGYKFTYRLPGAWDHALKRKVPMREFDARYSGDYLLSKHEVQEGRGGAIVLHIPTSDDKGYQKEKTVDLGAYDQALEDASPERDPLEEIFDRCAVVGNSGVLLHFAHGDRIDEHEAVFRFNDGPTKGYEKYVGKKTTFRIVGEKFLDFREGTETVIHDARKKSVIEAYKRRAYYTRREQEPFYLFSPEFAQVMAASVMEYEPTIGWKGIMTAMQVCRRVDIYGFFVTELHGTPYHYYDTCSHGRDKVQQEHRDDREWILVKNLKASQLLHFDEPCVEECRVTKGLCEACRAREPRYIRTVMSSVAQQRRQAERPGHCKESRVHHPEEARRRRRTLGLEGGAAAGGRGGGAGLRRRRG